MAKKGVDQPDVDLDDEDAPEEEIAEDAMETEEANKKSLKLTYDKYKKISFMLIDFIRKKDNEAEAQAEQEDNLPRKSDVVNWYLEEQSDEIGSQDELLEQRRIVEKVVDRLVYGDQVLVTIDNYSKGADPFLVVHPNYCQDA